MSTNGVVNQPYIPPVNKSTDAERIDFATSQFLKILQEDKRVAEAHQRNEEEKRRQRGEDLTPADAPKRPAPLTPAQARARGEPVPARPGSTDPQALAAPTPPGQLVAGQARIDPARIDAAPLVAERAPRGAPQPLPTGAPQQPPSTGSSRAPSAPSAVQAPVAPAPLAAASLAGLPPGMPSLSIVDTRTLGLLAGNAAAAQPTGRLVGPIQPPGAPAPQALDAAGPLVGPATRGLGLTPRTQPPALNATTPGPVRERIDKAVATGVLDTAPLRFAPVEPLASVDPAGQRGTPRAAPVSPLARSVATKPTPTSPPTGEAPAAASSPLAPANDVGPAREPANPLAANDAPGALGLALFQDVSRRAASTAAPAPPPPAPPPTLVQQTGSAIRDAGHGAALAGAKGGPERRVETRPESRGDGAPRAAAPRDRAAPPAAEPAPRPADRAGAPTLLGVPGLGPRRP